MKYEILYQPSFAVAQILLEPGERIRAESGAMVSMSPTVEMESKVTGGLKGMLTRALTKESLFQTYFTATGGPGEVVLAPSAIGDIIPLELQNDSYMVTGGSYLAGDPDLDMQVRVSGRAFFAGEGLFLMRVSGTGPLLLSSFGAIRAISLPAGHQYIVDTGHIVAFSESMQYEVRRAARSLIGSFTSGEGLVAHFIGPGVLYTQSRTPQGFGPWLAQFMPKGS
ncbi:MAG: TIGR00266 family protein [Fimbriimonadaceae bacterium]